MRILWYAGLLLLAGFVLFACQSGDLSLGQSVVNPLELRIQSVDTVTIKTSTVMRPDSFLTSTDPNLVVGQWTDAKTGVMTARSFAAINYASNSFATQTGLQLDSLVMELTYAYVYGDTTSLFNLSVHPLTKSIVSFDPLTRNIATPIYYNTNSASYQATPLIQTSVFPQPLSRTRQIRLRMTDAMAQQFFTKLSTNEINDAFTLAAYLPGFALQCNSKTNAMVGLAPASSGLRLYYHTTDVNLTSASVLFPLTATYFTQLQNNASGTALSSLKTRFDAVSSNLTDNTTFIVPGAGLQTRIEFPYLDQFARPNGYADVNKALLIVSPVRRDFFDNSPPPASLALYFTDNQNDLLLNSIVPSGIAGSVASIPTAPYTYDQTALILTDAYAFDLTSYIGQIIKRRASVQPMILTIAPPASNTPLTLRDRIQRVVLGNQQRPNDQFTMRLFFTSGS